MDYEEKLEFMKNAILTGFDGIWSDGKYKACVKVTPNSIEITEFKKIIHE